MVKALNGKTWTIILANGGKGRNKGMGKPINRKLMLFIKGNGKQALNMERLFKSLLIQISKATSCLE